jgi:predicted GNAT family acetyltransferase
MDNITLELNNFKRGAFLVREGVEQLAEMEVGIVGDNLTVYHTEVSPKLQGKGVAQQLLNHMVDYAREHKLRVIPLCPYVLAQFKRHPEKYVDLWNKDWHTKEK